jgi:hypothetical protein
MSTSLPEGIAELREEECIAIHGGGIDPLSAVVYLTSCFAAGFAFGYDRLGPRLFG